MVPPGLEKEREELEIGGWIETIQATAVLRTPVKDHRLMVWKTRKKYNNNNNKTVEYEGVNYTNCDSCFWYSN